MKSLFAIPFLLVTAALSAAEKPNIIFIMADDLGYGDLGCYGQKLIATPHIDRLAEEGIRFTQAYAGGCVCTPSRSVLMTGLHNGHTRARDNVPHYSTYLQDDDVTVAEVLKNAGYQCGGIGKWSLGDAGTVGRATNQGFHKWFGYLNQDHAHYYFPEYLDDDEDRFDLAGNTKSRKHYSHGLLTDNALEFIRESKDGPFFLYAAYALPHFSSKEEDKDGLAVPSLAPYTDQAGWESKAKKYGAMLDMIDKDVGKIVRLIDELGLSENTLIVFTSDNGGHSTIPARINTSGPLRGFKRSLTEGGIRVPFIARWTGKVPANQTSDEVIAFQDMMPTLAGIAGGEVPEGLDGTDILPALMGGKVPDPHEYLYWDYGHCRGKHYAQAVRLGEWKGIRSKGEFQLFDLSKDIGETTDLATQHPNVVSRIEKIMEDSVIPNPQYPIGTTYKGGPIWKKGH